MSTDGRSDTIPGVLRRRGEGGRTYYAQATACERGSQVRSRACPIGVLASQEVRGDEVLRVPDDGFNVLCVEGNPT